MRSFQCISEKILEIPYAIIAYQDAFIAIKQTRSLHPVTGARLLSLKV